MDATNTMLCWNPGTEDVALIPWPDTARLSDKFRMTSLACYTHVQEMDFEGRKKYIFITAMHLIVRDKCNPTAVHSALLGLDEYIDGCSHDMPGVMEASV